MQFSTTIKSTASFVTRIPGRFWITVATAAAVLALAGCAHPISIQAKQVPEPNAPASNKKVAYVLSEADRGRQVTTDGGGGDKISYYPYRDFERALRAALAANYGEVIALTSTTDAAAIRNAGASYVFVPDISTTSGSGSLLTWPPTTFSVIVSVDVLDPMGVPVTRLRVIGSGAAEFSEFKGEFGLAGRRAVENAARALADEIQRSERLR